MVLLILILTAQAIADFQWEAGAENKCRTIAIQSDGKILMAGRAMNPVTQQYDFALMRSLTTGQLDSTFGDDGRLLTSIRSSDDDIFSMYITSNNSILVSGLSDTIGCNTCPETVVAKYFPDGNTGAKNIVSATESILLFPNPSDDIIHIQGIASYDIIDVNIYSITGRQITAGTGNTLSVKNIAPGAYIAAIHLSNHIVIYRQFIIHH